MEEFNSIKLDEMDDKYRNARQDRHYFGLAKSIIIGVRRMARFCDDSDARAGTTGSKRAALGLLMALALVHESLTPLQLFRLSPEEVRRVEERSRTAKRGAQPVSVQSLSNVPAVHAGVMCGKSKQNPIVGPRYRKIGHDYGLNEGEFS